MEDVSREELVKRYEGLKQRSAKLEELLQIISRGKYMWESTFDAITAPVQIVTGEYDVVRANLSLAAVCSKDIAAVIGRKCYKVFAGRDRPCGGCPLKSSVSQDARIMHKLENVINGLKFEASAYPLIRAVGGQVVLFYRDITEEERLQVEAIQQEKMAAIGMLAGGVAHEINNPLGGILAFTQLLKRDASCNDVMKGDLEEIEKAAVRCKKIVADLLDFSRASKEKERCVLDLNVLLEKIFPFIQREIRSLNVELVFDGAAGLPQITAIPDRLQQVFLNLMTNACHAMVKGGKLTVKTRSINHGSAIQVRVADTGTGIPPEIRNRVFDPFFTTKGPGQGTGLGLSISYRIVKEHGGEISFHNLKGGGTEFVVILPSNIAKEGGYGAHTGR